MIEQKAGNDRFGPPTEIAAPNWESLKNFTDAQSACRAWLAIICDKIGGVSIGLVRIFGEDGAAVATASWPDQHAEYLDLAANCDRALLDRRSAVSIGRVGDGKTHPQAVGLLVSVPLTAGKGHPIGVVGVAMSTSRGSANLAPENVAEQLTWGAGWLQALPWASKAQEASQFTDRAAFALDLLATVGEHKSLKASSLALVNELATRLRCDRCCVGFADKKGDIRLKAMSHSSGFKRHAAVVEALEAAMQEAFDQKATIAIADAQPVEGVVTFFTRALRGAATVSGSAILSIPVNSGPGRTLGVVTFERHDLGPFSRDERNLIDAAIELVGPYLDLQLKSDRLLSGRIVDRAAEATTALIGPGRPSLKLSAVAISLLAIGLFFAEGTHRVTAKAVLEGEVQQAAVAPFDGFIRRAPIRAGDLVRKGDLLAALDDRDLVLDRLKWRAELDKLLQKERDALAKHDRPLVVVLKAQINQAEAQLKLAEEKLARAQLFAPFDGVVVSGDLSQMLGSPIERGKVLFETTPLNAYRVIIHLDERDIRFVSTGQRGKVSLTGRPDGQLPLAISKITSVTTAEEGRNTFRVEGRVLGDINSSLRPGMEGTAKIDAGSKSLIWIWTHSLVDWARLAAWKYIP